jgi:hypothetical protein
VIVVCADLVVERLSAEECQAPPMAMEKLSTCMAVML